MENGSCYPCQALFFPAEVKSHAGLAERLGRELAGPVRGNRRSSGAGIQGLFFTAEPEGGLEMAISAAADGVEAAEAINQWLTRADQSYLAAPSLTFQA